MLRRRVGLIAVIAVLVAACGSETGDSTTTVGSETTTTAAETTTTEAPTTTAEESGGVIGFAHGVENDAAYPPVSAAARAQAEARGYELLEGSANGDCEAQIGNIETYIAQVVDAIVILPFCGLDTYTDVVARAQDAGILVFGYATAFPEGDGALIYDTIPGSEELANEAVRWVENDLPAAPDYDGEFSWGLLTFDQCGAPCTERTDTARTIIVDATGVDPQECEAVQTEEGFTCVETMLQADPGMDMVIAVGSAGGLGAFEAISQTGKSPESIFVGSWDGDKEALQFLLDDTGYRGVAAISLTTIGQTVVDMPADVLEGVVPAGTDTLLPYIVITPADPDLAQSYIDELP